MHEVKVSLPLLDFKFVLFYIILFVVRGPESQVLVQSFEAQDKLNLKISSIKDYNQG